MGDIITAKDLSKGTTVLMDGRIYQVTDMSMAKYAQAKLIIRAKLKDFLQGNVIEKVFKSEEKMERAFIERKPLQYLYKDADSFHFMEKDTFEQLALPQDHLSEEGKYLKDDLEVTGLYYDDKLLGIELPNSVDLVIVETDPGLRGDTASGGSKPAKLETGLTITVPLFVDQGQMIRVDTRTGQYLMRV